jgi:hypothetical protein
MGVEGDCIGGIAHGLDEVVDDVKEYEEATHEELL